MEKREPSCTVGQNVNWSNHYGKQYLRNLYIELPLPYDPAIPLLGIYPDKSFLEKGTCTRMLTAALFTIAKTWKQPNVHRWKIGLGKGSIYTQWNILSHKKNKIMPFAVTWMELETLTLSEVSQKEKGKSLITDSNTYHISDFQ